MSIIEEKIASSLFILHKLQQRLHNFMESKPRKIKTRSWCWKLIYFSYINIYIYSSTRMKIAYTHMTWLAVVTLKNAYNVARLQSSIWVTVRLLDRRLTTFFWFSRSWLWIREAISFATTAWRSWIGGAKSRAWIWKHLYCSTKKK
jgi:hypothetical protein